MKTLMNTIAIGAALAAGVISVFQDAPFLVFAKRVALSAAGFYAIGFGLTLLWNAASGGGGPMPAPTRREGGDRDDEGGQAKK
jgi:hypothetical protein